MNKEIIYIDNEDDITTIIGKVNDAKESIIAIVPPKRASSLQSAVNLKLLQRAARNKQKRLVLITNNSALMALSSSLQIPVARTLQSKPEIAEIAGLSIDDDDDIIDGAQLAVGDHVDLAAGAVNKQSNPYTSEDVTNSDADPAIILGSSTLPKEVKKSSLDNSKFLNNVNNKKNGTKDKKHTKVPDFNKFRKRLILIIIAGILLIAFLIWALFFAGSARIIITARTSELAVSPNVTIGTSLQTDVTQSTLKAVSKELKKDVNVTFNATGTKEVGDKAKGQVTFQNCEAQVSITVPAGTTVGASGVTYETLEAVAVPAASGTFRGCSTPGTSVPVDVVATNIGESSNARSGTVLTVSGHPNNDSASYFNATASSAIDGGTSRQIKVVTDEDIQNASEKLATQSNDDIEKELNRQFSNTVTTLPDSFTVAQADIQPEPASGAEAPGGTAKLTVASTFTLLGVDQAELNSFLDGYDTTKLTDSKTQRVYENGAKDSQFSDVTKAEGTYIAKLSAVAQVGPKVDEFSIKQQSINKRYGEIQSSLEAIDGIDTVDVKFSPFWKSKAPSDPEKISIDFDIKENDKS